MVAIPVVLLHQVYLRASSPPGERPGRTLWWSEPFVNLSVRAGIFALAVALIVAAPWHLWIARTHGIGVVASWLAPFDIAPAASPGLLARLIRLAPATLPLGLFAAVRAIRRALADESDDQAIVGGVFWVLWLAVAALVPAFWPSGPWHLTSLFLLVPLNLLAASAVSDLATRKAPVRTLTWLAPATAATVVWLLSANLSNAVNDLIRGRIDAATALGLHLAVDILILAVWLTRTLDRWARRRDDRQRQVLAGFLLAVLAVTVGSGSREVLFQHQETDDLLRLRTMILWINRERPFRQVAVVGPDVFRPTAEDGLLPGGRLRFILRTALPRLPQIDLVKSEDLLTLPDPDAQRLVIVVGRNPTFASLQNRLGLEQIHPGREGMFAAYATAGALSKSGAATATSR